MTQTMIDQAIQVALGHHKAGRLGEAEAIYRQVLAQAPAHFGAMHWLGLVNYQNGKSADAIELLTRAIAINPASPEAHCNLGNMLREAGRFKEAAVSCRTAIALRPNFSEAHNNLGAALTSLRDYDQAIAAFSKAIEFSPNYAVACNNLGNALKDKGDLDRAVKAYARAIQLKPDFAEAHYNLGNALQIQRKYREATDAYSSAIHLMPGYVLAYTNMGAALKEQGKLDEAIAAYRKAIDLKPDAGETYGNLGTVLKDQGKLEQALDCYRKAAELNPENPGWLSNRILTLHYHPDYDADALLEEARSWDRIYAEPLKHCFIPHDNDRAASRRLKIGYVSPDFRYHAVTQMILPLLANHDHRQFEICCYADVAQPDYVTEKVKQYADQWHQTLNLSDEELALKIRADRIDILIDLAAHTAGNRLRVFARRPAPVQATWFPGTTGLSAIDYRLTDIYFDPAGAENEPYSEKSIRLKSEWCFAPRDLPDVKPPPAFSAGHITFGCLNNFGKINSEVLQTWVQILLQIPDSRLIIKSDPGSHLDELNRFFTNAKIASDRIEYVGKLPEKQYYELFHRIDLGLDPFPFNGHTTTFDFLWMGVPVVTLAGRTCVGRAGVSILSNLGLPELISASPDEYVSIAVNLATNLPALSELRKSMRQRMRASPLMDAPGYARDVEAAFQTMWRETVRS